MYEYSTRCEHCRLPPVFYRLVLPAEWAHELHIAPIVLPRADCAAGREHRCAPGPRFVFWQYSRKTKPVIAMRAGARHSSLRRTPLACRSCCPNVRTVHITGIRPTRGAKIDFDVRLMRSRSSARERTIANEYLRIAQLQDMSRRSGISGAESTWSTFGGRYMWAVFPDGVGVGVAR